MHLYMIENPHAPSVISLMQVDKCELCKALVEATDYDEHAHSHAPEVETPDETETPQTPKPPKLNRGKTE